MSLFKAIARKHWSVGLASEQLACVVRQGVHLDTASAYRETIQNPAGHWQPVLNIFRKSRQQLAGSMRSLPISVILSGRWCYMMVVPWSDAMLTPGGAERFLQTQFAAVYGDAASGWMIAADEAPYGQPRLACAIERAIVDQLQDIARENNTRCLSIEPILSAVWRNTVARAGTKMKAIALVEPDRLTFASARRGCITAVHSYTSHQLQSGEIVQAWRRWCLLAPENEGIEHVALINLTGKAIHGALPELFSVVAMPFCGLDASYGAVTLREAV